MASLAVSPDGSSGGSLALIPDPVLRGLRCRVAQRVRQQHAFRDPGFGGTVGALWARLGSLHSGSRALSGEATRASRYVDWSAASAAVRAGELCSQCGDNWADP